MSRKIAVELCVLIFVSCFASDCRSIPSHALTTANTREIASPAPIQALSPRAIATRDGSVLLTWLEPINDKLAALQDAGREGVIVFLDSQSGRNDARN